MRQGLQADRGDGATGFVGQHLFPRLQAGGDEVVSLSRRTGIASSCCMTLTAASAVALRDSCVSWATIGTFASCRSTSPARSLTHRPWKSSSTRCMSGTSAAGPSLAQCASGIADEVPLLRPLAFGARMPVIGRFVEWASARVAGNRHRTSRLFGDDACPIRPGTL